MLTQLSTNFNQITNQKNNKITFGASFELIGRKIGEDAKLIRNVISEDEIKALDFFAKHAGTDENKITVHLGDEFSTTTQKGAIETTMPITITHDICGESQQICAKAEHYDYSNYPEPQRTSMSVFSGGNTVYYVLKNIITELRPNPKQSFWS